jgi:environmental stress-induced protein Ves
MLRKIANELYKKMPWKNGQGLSHEILRLPEGSETLADFDCRVSVAEIHGENEFSAYPGCDRLLAVWQGGEIVLHIGSDKSVHLRREPLHFKGEDIVNCEAAQAPVRDIGVIYRRSFYQAFMSHHRLASGASYTLDDQEPNRPASAHTKLIFCAVGKLQYELSSTKHDLFTPAVAVPPAPIATPQAAAGAPQATLGLLDTLHWEVSASDAQTLTLHNKSSLEAEFYQITLIKKVPM